MRASCKVKNSTHCCSKAIEFGKFFNPRTRWLLLRDNEMSDTSYDLTHQFCLWFLDVRLWRCTSDSDAIIWGRSLSVSTSKLLTHHSGEKAPSWWAALMDQNTCVPNMQAPVFSRILLFSANDRPLEVHPNLNTAHKSRAPVKAKLRILGSWTSSGGAFLPSRFPSHEIRHAARLSSICGTRPHSRKPPITHMFQVKQLLRHFN